MIGRQKNTAFSYPRHRVKIAAELGKSFVPMRITRIVNQIHGLTGQVFTTAFRSETIR
jgi:hypothetical protein